MEPSDGAPAPGRSLADERGSVLKAALIVVGGLLFVAFFLVIGYLMYSSLPKPTAP